MSKIIQTLEKTSINTKEKLHLSSSVTRYGYFDKGEYQAYLDETILFIENEEFIDVYSLLLALCSEFILMIEDNDYVTQIFNSYIDFIENNYYQLSPTDYNQKKSFLEKGINLTISFIYANLSDIYQETKIDTDVFQENLNRLFSFLNEKEISHDEHTKSQLFSLLLKISQIKQSRINNNDEDEKDISHATDECDDIEKNEDITDTTIENKDISKNYGSYKWALLVKRIKAIEDLIGNDRLVEAAIIYNDLQKIIEKFDPNEYFPEVFAPLYKILTPIAPKIYTSIELLSGTPGWEIAQRMYETDLETFIHDLPKMTENDHLSS